MSARVESPPIGGGTLRGSFVIAVVVALSIGAFLGSLVTYAIDNDGGASPTFVARGTPALTAMDAGYGSKAIEARCSPSGSAGWDRRTCGTPAGSRRWRAANWPRSGRHRPRGGPLG
jgi:hypothetical protein